MAGAHNGTRRADECQGGVATGVGKSVGGTVVVSTSAPPVSVAHFRLIVSNRL